MPGSILHRFRPLALLFCLANLLTAATLRIRVQDPSGAAISGAAISIRLPQSPDTTAQATSGPDGTASLPNIKPGTYSLTVSKASFETAEQPIGVPSDEPLDVRITLRIATQQTSVEVSGKASKFANSDPNYRALRTAQPQGTFHVENLEITRDVGKFTFRSGDFSFAPPVLGKTVLAVFTGDGSFHLTPHTQVDRNYLNMISGAPEVEEKFRSIVLAFTDDTDTAIRAVATARDATASTASAYHEFRQRVRRRGDNARSLTEYLFGGEQIPNIDADLLMELYSPSRHSFQAFIHGQKHGDLRFILNDSGALPDLPSPEEVGLLNIDPYLDSDGVWYLSHTLKEWKTGSPASTENNRRVEARAYRTETAIASNGHLGSTAHVRFHVLADGTRVVKFGLLPSLRVLQVRLAGKEIPYIQEGRKEDGSFYVILPEPAKLGSDVEVVVDYEGDKVLTDAGGGSFAVGARDSWYPSLNSFSDRATYDLTFRVPKRYSLISIGKLVKEWKDGDYYATQWVSEIPLAVAGFNYGDFKMFSKHDVDTNYDLEAWAGKIMPNYLAQSNMSLSPTSMAQNTLIDAGNSMHIFEKYFGKIPYGRLAITQQPQFSFGQSWPSLVYLPLSAFLDDTQRWMLLGSNASRFAEFIEEVTPHEVAHQWWGHAVGWASYHDQWLSEGFANFSAGLYLQVTGQQDRWMKYLNRGREKLADKNAFGLRPGEVAPLWMGLRLNVFKAPRAYNEVVYTKGGFVLHMLRQMMWDPNTRDKDFIDMMHDFVSSHFNKPASTEDFMDTVNAHMKPQMDLAGSKNMAWFFTQWVYGTEVPRYRFDYTVTPQDGGKYLLTGKLTQSGVTDNFMMKVPVYVEFDAKQTVRLGSVPVLGNSTSQEIKTLLPKKPKHVAANLFQDVLSLETANSEH